MSGDLRQVGDEIEVRQLDALRQSRGAGGERQKRHVSCRVANDLTMGRWRRGKRVSDILSKNLIRSDAGGDAGRGKRKSDDDNFHVMQTRISADGRLGDLQQVDRREEKFCRCG